MSMLRCPLCDGVILHDDIRCSGTFGGSAEMTARCPTCCRDVRYGYVDEWRVKEDAENEIAEGKGHLFETCEAVGICPMPSALTAPFHHFYWDCDRDEERMERIHGEDGQGHDDPLSKFGAVKCKTCGRTALVKSDADDFPTL